MNFCKNFEKCEKGLIAPFGCPNTQSKKRVCSEIMRAVFQLGGFRIVYPNAFLHLKYKTLVFLSPLGDQYRTCLTHILEVVQFATTITRAFFFPLRLCTEPVFDKKSPT